MAKMLKPGYLASRFLEPVQASGVLLLEDSSNLVEWYSTTDFSRLPDDVIADLTAKTYRISMELSLSAFSKSYLVDVDVGKRARISEGLAGSGDFPDTEGALEFDDLGVSSFEDFYTGNFSVDSFNDYIFGWTDPVRSRFSYSEVIEGDPGEHSVVRSTLDSRGPILYFRKEETATEFGAAFLMTATASEEAFISDVSQGIVEEASATVYITPGNNYTDSDFDFSVDVVNRWSITA